MAVFFTLMVGALAAVLILAIGFQRGRIPAWMVVSAPLLTAGVLVFSILNATAGERLGGLRLALEGVSFQTGARQVLSIGGDAARDDIVARGLPSRAIVLEVLPDRIIGRVAGLSGDTVKVGYGRFRERLTDNTVSTWRLDRPVFLTISGAVCGEIQRAITRKYQSCRLMLSRAGGGRFQVGFVDPEAAVYMPNTIDRAFDVLGPEAHGSLRLMLQGGAIGSAATTATGLNFESIGRATETSIPGRILVFRTSDMFTVESATEAARLPYGSSFTLGGRTQALMRMDRQDMHWRVYDLTNWLPYLALVVSLLGTWGARRSAPVAFILLSLVDFLLTMRLLVAMDAAYTSTRVDMVQAVRDALEALCVAPFLVALFALPPPERAGATRGAQGLFGLAAVWLVSGHWGGLDGIGWLFSAACVFGLLLTIFRVDAAACCMSGFRWLGRRGRRLGRYFERAGPRARAWMQVYLASPWFPLTMLCLLGGVRYGLVAGLHVHDRLLPVGPRIAVTLLYVPPLVVLAAWSFHRVASALGREDVGRLYAVGLAMGWWVSLGVAFLWIFPDRDKGFAFVNIWPFLLLGAIAAFFIARRRLMAAGVLGGPWWLGVVAIVLVHSWAHFGPRTDEIAAAARTQDPAEAAALLGSYASDTKEWMRLQQLAAPDWLAQIGTRDAEGLRETFAHMAAYADTRFGRGFIPTEPPTSLFDPQLRDNVASVHIISPFGVAGAAAFLAVLLVGSLVPAGLALARRGWDPAKLSVPASTGVLALWVFGGAGVYMVLANLQITPFTGRDIYLLGADSVSDLIEGLTLIVIALRFLDREAVE